MRGGATSLLAPSPLIPSDLSNIHRSITGSMTNTMNAYNGFDADPSPLPYKDQLTTGPSIGDVLRTA